MDGWVPANLTSSHIIMSRMEGKTKYVITVGGIEPLLVGGACVDHTQCCNVVDYVPIFCVEKVVATIIATITESRQ